ncbi:MAG: D-aminoacyl-tRNA deacylase [Candidatus ainarchaeum sp.]|nr:D-aminoacyl-tRNA deacylase [Candidatus ainarchaeum sp.]
MNILLINSKKDDASNNLTKSLENIYNFKKIKENLYILDEINNLNQISLIKIDKLHIYLEKEYLEKITKDYDIVIFLSKHSTLSETKPKAMTVHAIGNFGKAELGGEDKILVQTDPILIRLLLYNLKKNKIKEIKPYEVKQEATHHGPYLEKTALFYEIGSQKSDWENKDVGEYMAKILIQTIRNYNKEEIKKKNNWIEAVGISKSHYCTQFNKYTFKKNFKYCIGHVFPKYALKEYKNNNLEEEILKKINTKIIINEKNISNFT